ncbi:hypothetical protein TNCV_845971 [Trichonephila clavipes]|nr:hypothetical protein TNCV_845971 [Trichonephila clavipes]
MDIYGDGYPMIRFEESERFQPKSSYANDYGNYCAKKDSQRTADVKGVNAPRLDSRPTGKISGEICRHSNVLTSGCKFGERVPALVSSSSLDHVSKWQGR